MRRPRRWLMSSGDDVLFAHVWKPLAAIVLRIAHEARALRVEHETDTLRMEHEVRTLRLHR